MASAAIRRGIRTGLKALLLLAALPLLYFLAAAIGSLIPANADWREAPGGVTIFVRTNGVHTWILAPKNAAGIDWSPFADPSHIKDARYAAGDYLAFGFGNRDFYLNTPNWSDLSLPTAFAAAFGRGPALVHVDHVWNPQPDEYQQPIRITADQYRQMARLIRGSFVFDNSGKPIPLIGRGYGPSDVFFEASGRYDGRRTCNEWTGEMLRNAGVRTGIWTPLSQSLMWRLPFEQPQQATD